MADLIEDNVDRIVESFDDLRLHENLLHCIYPRGFEKSSAIQQYAIRPVLGGHDAIGQAQSGTGKTATRVENCLRKIDYTHGTCQSLVLAPTRELAQQIQKVALALDDYLKIRWHACIGGKSVRDNIEKSREGQ